MLTVDKLLSGRWASATCECGNVVEVDVYKVNSGHKKSCGCLSGKAAKERAERARENKVGMRFGRLVVAADAGSVGESGLLRCACDCGKDLVVRHSDLSSGNTRSCGCLNEEKIKERSEAAISAAAGLKFGRLTIVGPGVVGSGRRKYLCACDCGAHVFSTLDDLSSGNTMSCGCLRSEVSRKKSLAARSGDRAMRAELSVLYNSYKMAAKKKGRKFDLSKDEFLALVSSDCHYCGASPGRRIKGYHNDSGLRWNGVDRIDNSLGYSLENCQAACWTCNRTRGAMDYNEFMSLVRTISSCHPLPAPLPAVLHGPWANRNSEASPLQWAVQ